MRRVFWNINNIFMVPMFRLGLDPFIGNVVTGYYGFENGRQKNGKDSFYASQLCYSNWNN
jgi:hypothetical protein